MAPRINDAHDAYLLALSCDLELEGHCSIDDDFDEYRADELNDFHGLENDETERSVKETGHGW